MARIAQLRGVMPALDESDITRERLALEEAIRKVEAESARLFVEASRRMSAEKLRQARQSAAQPLVEADFITELEQLLSKFRSQSADPVADNQRRTAEAWRNLTGRLNQEDHGAKIELTEEGVFRFSLQLEPRPTAMLRLIRRHKSFRPKFSAKHMT